MDRYIMDKWIINKGVTGSKFLSKELIYAIIFVFMISSLKLYGQNTATSDNHSAVTVTPTKKVIYPEKLNLPSNTTIITILGILPEMLDRDSENSFDNYTIMVDGLDVEDSREIILQNIRLEDIKQIVIYESPIKSFISLGQGGIIDISLKDVNEKGDGYVSCNYSNLNYIAPMAFYGIKHKNISIKAMAAYDYYDPNVYKTFSSIEADNNSYDLGTRLDNSMTSAQMARVQLQYTPTESDKLSFAISENYARETSDVRYEPNTRSNTRDTKTKNLDLNADASYTHTFNNKSSLTGQFSYTYNPKNYYLKIPSNSYDNTIRGHYLGGSVAYSLPISKKVNISAGTNFNVSISRNTTHSDFQYMQKDYDTKANTNFISPYVAFDFKLGKFSINTQLEYQYYNYKVKGDNYEDCNESRNDITGKIATGWKIDDNNFLRLVLDRRLKRPTSEMIYPFFVYSSTYGTYLSGNTDLIPTMFHEAKLEYTRNIKTANNTEMIIDAAVSYTRIDNIIHLSSKVLLPFSYLTFSNSGNSDIANGNAMFFLKHGIFSFSFTGNLYFRQDYYNEQREHYKYYQLAVMPSFNFQRGWMGSLYFCYTSSIEQSSSRLGPCPYGRITIGKEWKRWQLHAFASCILSGRATDTSYSIEGNTLSTYYQDVPTIGITAKFKF